MLSIWIANLLAPWWWVCDLTVHFQWQSLILGLLTMALALAGRNTIVLCFGLGSVLWHGGHLAPFYFPVTETAGFQFKAITFNVYAHNSNREAVLAFLRAEQPEILCLEELTTFWDRTLRPEFRYRAARPTEGAFGGGIYSRYPLRDLVEVPLSENNIAVQATVEFPDGDLIVLVVHPMPCVSATATRTRDSQIRAITRHCQQLTGPVLVMGDFNATPWTAALRELEQQTSLRNSLRGAGLQTTWPSSNLLLTVPIDHLFHSPEVAIVRRWTGPACGSDHYPIVAVCRLQ